MDDELKMPDVQSAFLVSVLGPDGAEAICRAVRKSEVLAQVLVPRTLLSWSALIGSYGYEGAVPGVEKSYLSLSKSETGFGGTLLLGDDSVSFQRASVYELAAHLAIALQVQDGIPADQLRGVDLTRLGKSIDLLVRTRAVAELRKAGFVAPTAADAAGRKAMIAAIPGRKPGMAPGASDAAAPPPALKPPPPIASHVTAPPSLGAAKMGGTGVTPKPTFAAPSRAESASRKAIFGAIPGRTAGMAPGQSIQSTPPPAATTPAKPAAIAAAVGKAELPGQQAKPQQQMAPIPPTQPTKQPKQQRQVAKLPKLKIAKAEQSLPCPVCHRPQFRGSSFAGCLCFAGLAKSVRTLVLPGGDAVVSFGSGWDIGAIEVLIGSLHGVRDG